MSKRNVQEAFKELEDLKSKEENAKEEYEEEMKEYGNK